MKRIITLFLALVMLISVASLFACAPADTTDPNNGKTPTDTKKTTYDPALKDLDFGGQEISFVFAEGARDTYTERSIMVEEDDGDAVNTQLITRNANVEEALGVTIVSTRATDNFAGLRGAIQNSLSAGTGDYDIIAGYQYFDIGMATEGWLVDLNKLGENYNADYIDFDAEYWGKYYNENLMYGNSRYWITGDIALRYIGGMYCTFVNKTIYEKKLNEKYGNIYDIARNGDWTMDLLTEMAALCYDDTDGDEKVSETDTVGFGYEIMDPIDGIAFGCEVPFSTKDADGKISITIKDKKTEEFVDKLDKLLHGSFAFEFEGADSDTVMPAFNNGTVAFTTNKIFMAESYLQQMDDDYYVIPSPKMNKDQQYYVSGVHDGCTIFGIAWDSPNVPAAAATLEVMAAESLRLVTPVYYESSLKFKYTRDNDSADMIDLIRQHVETDFAAVWSNNIDNIAHFFRSYNTTRNITSNLKRRTEVYKEKLKDLIKAFEELEEEG